MPSAHYPPLLVDILRHAAMDQETQLGVFVVFLLLVQRLIREWVGYGSSRATCDPA